MTSIEVGARAPTIVLRDDRGERWSSEEHPGRDVVLVFHRHFY